MTYHIAHIADFYSHLANEAFARCAESNTYADRAFFAKLGHNWRNEEADTFALSCGEEMGRAA